MKTLSLSILTILLPLLFCTSCKQKKEQNENNGTTVRTIQVKQSNDLRKREYTFTAKPFRTSELSFRVSGPITTSTNYVGNYYRKGDIIASIDQRDFKIKKERTEAIYNQAKAEFERVENLYHKNNISLSAYDKAQADYITAKTAFENACNELNDTFLKAPTNGYVNEVYIEQYQDAKATQPIVSFIDIDHLKIEAYVPQEIAANVSVPSKVSICFDAFPQECYEAEISEISKNTTRNNLSYLLTAIISNQDRKLLSGMSGKMKLDSKSNDNNLISIPQTALCHRSTVGDYVWVIDQSNNTAQRRNVKVNEILPNGQISIAEGLTPGEVIATSGLRFLSNGTKITEQRN